MSAPDVWADGAMVSVTADVMLTPDAARSLARSLTMAADAAEGSGSELPCYCGRVDCPRCMLA